MEIWLRKKDLKKENREIGVIVRFKLIKKIGIGWGWSGGIEKCDKLKMIIYKKSKYFMFYVIVCCYMMWLLI